MLPLPVCSSELLATDVVVCDDLLLGRRWASTAARRSGARQTLRRHQQRKECPPIWRIFGTRWCAIKPLIPLLFLIVGEKLWTQTITLLYHLQEPFDSLRVKPARLRFALSLLSAAACARILPLNGWQAPGLSVSSMAASMAAWFEDGRPCYPFTI